MTETYTYDAFGTLTYIQSLNEEGVLAQTDTALSRFLYAGEQYDEVTGLYYLRARRYDTTVGRFTQEDTYLGDGRNLYVYVQNNPLKYVDPSGYSKDTGYRAKNNFWNAILQGAVISSQMADSYSGQVGKDWGNHIEPTVREDPKGSARDLAIGVIDSISPIPTGLDKYVEHQDLYMTGAIFTMAFGGGFDDAVESVAKTASKMDEIADAVDTVTDLSKSNLDELVDGADTVGDLLKSDADDVVISGCIPDGYYQDINGRWHRPNGQFASNAEIGISTSSVNTTNGIHGNSLENTKTNYGYALVDRDTNEILKFGETLYPETRYSQGYLDANNANMMILEQGNKLDIHLWQHDMNEYYFYKYNEYPLLNSRGW